MQMRLIDLVQIRQPIYVPLGQNLLKVFTTESIARWLTTPSVRANIQKIDVIVNDIELGNRLNKKGFFNSPYTVEYQEYIRNVIIPTYVEFLSNVNLPKNELIERVLVYLASSATGNMFIPPNSTGFITNDVFPHLEMVKKPSQGNCYFCSIGYGVNVSPEDMRIAISNQIQENNEVAYLAKKYATDCKTGKFYRQYLYDPTGFIASFPDLLKKPCQKDERDCNECIWGGNDYDSIAANIFSVPLLAISIDRQGKDASISISAEFGPLAASIYKKYVESSTIRYKTGQIYTFSFTYVFPDYIYQEYPNTEEALMVEFDNIIGYIYRGEHFNAIKFI